VTRVPRPLTPSAASTRPFTRSEATHPSLDTERSELPVP
jgi:hypothetical protein